jgi:two-component system, OmpR family, response regulator
MSMPSTRRAVLTGNDATFGASTATLRRVLFVSGDADLRAVVTRVLERQGYEVHAVAHSGHALLICRTMAVDVLVTELSGPDMSGPSMAQQLRRHCPGLSVIYLGNPGTPEGVDHVLVRPFTRDDLLERLQAAMSDAAAA